MTRCSRQVRRQQFTIAIICALPHEARAVETVFDEIFDRGSGADLASHPRDKNKYTLGRIGQLYVVSVHMPAMGKLYASTAASSISLSYPNIKLALVVGVCGGAPYTLDGHDIFLGDVIISTGLLLYDETNVLASDKFNPLAFNTGNRVQPNGKPKALIHKLYSARGYQRLLANTVDNLTPALNMHGDGEFGYPGMEEDRLFSPSYQHQHRSLVHCDVCSSSDSSKQFCHQAFKSTCEQLGCVEDTTQLQRIRAEHSDGLLPVPRPTIHFGPIATGDSVIMCGKKRDELAASDGIVGFEMEAAGVWMHFPAVVIKGVCDYADCHKSKRWQNYAAASAASCAKAFLLEYPAESPQAYPVHSPEKTIIHDLHSHAALSRARFVFQSVLDLFAKVATVSTTSSISDTVKMIVVFHTSSSFWTNFCIAALAFVIGYFYASAGAQLEEVAVG
jgi:nucleoside phosphorylase